MDSSHMSHDPVKGDPCGGKGPLATAAKIFRVTAAVTVFAVPLLVGTAVVIGAGVRGVYNVLARRREPSGR
jgi:hypothetical protein